MKRAFVRTSTGHLVSGWVPLATRDALNLGDRITTERPLDLREYGTIDAGATGTVDFIDALTGFTEILMDVQHRALDLWDNHLWLEPFGTEDILDGILCGMVAIAACQRVA